MELRCTQSIEQHSENIKMCTHFYTFYHWKALWKHQKRTSGKMGLVHGGNQWLGPGKAVSIESIESINWPKFNTQLSFINAVALIHSAESKLNGCCWCIVTVATTVSTAIALGYQFFFLSHQSSGKSKSHFSIFILNALHTVAKQFM